jgi:hypothetical protein
MSDESLEQVERQIASVRPVGPPVELRGAVLGGVHRELQAARWDRRLARAAVLLLVVGVGLNVAMARHGSNIRHATTRDIADARSQQSLVQSAVIVAETVDSDTARKYSRQLAAMRGWELSPDEAAEIDAAIHKATRIKTGGRG